MCHGRAGSAAEGPRRYARGVGAQKVFRLGGSACSDTAGVSGFAAHLLARADSLWVFADREGVPPTNNAAERAIRKAVLWRKGCFGSQSERGLRFVERMMTVVATKRRRAEGVLDYLVEVARNAITGTPAPRLIPQAPSA